MSIDYQTFFENKEALEKCIHYSGGCIRQLFRVINVAIRKTRGIRKISVKIVEEVADEIGNTMRESIDKSYVEILKSGDFEPAEAKVKEMLYGLLLLKYNGKSSIKINPILEKYLNNANEL